MNKYIVITSINKPTESVKAFSNLKDWNLVVVGDKKTPLNWRCKNVIYLSPEKQEDIANNLSKAIPWNHYSRKMIGYIYAIQMDADIITDTDDDNAPYENWGENISFTGEFDTVDSNDFYNVYKSFTKESIWPRGYPLNKVLDAKKIVTFKQKTSVGIWQHLADGDTDVDAIYRLTNNKKIIFKKSKPVILSEGTTCPFNSQNTTFRKELFPLLYLPAHVTFRFTDILRGLVAQPIMWAAGYRLGFSSASVFQDRNEHSYMKDFESEIPMYLNSEKIVQIVKESINKNNSVSKNLLSAYTALKNHNIVTNEECLVLKEWLRIVNI